MALERKFNPFSNTFDYYADNIIINFKNFVITVNDLPLEGNNTNDARFVNDNNHLYIWSGVSWIDQGLVFKNSSGQYFT